MLNRLDALGDATPFDGFVEADFDAFIPKKHASRVYTMERRATRAKAVAIARTALERIGGDLELGASDDAPTMANNRKVHAVWAYLTRPPTQRNAIASKLGRTDLSDRAALFDILVEHQHASLLFSVDVEAFSIELHLSPRAGVDRTNAARKLAYAEDRARLIEQLSAMEGAFVGLDDDLHSASEVDDAVVEGWAEAIPQSPRPFMLRRSWHRSEARLLETSFEDEAVEVAAAFAEVLRHLAWSADNDFAKIGVEKAVAKAEKKLEKSGKTAAEPGPKPGARVTILSGMFAGRSGYLAEPDGKGNVKVMVGPVSVSVPAEDVKLA